MNNAIKFEAIHLGLETSIDLGCVITQISNSLSLV